MFIGTYYHKLEAKGRLSLPKAFRQSASDPHNIVNNDWVITPGLDGGLFLFVATDFQVELQKLAQLEFNQSDARNFIRLMTNQATPVSLDKTGRLLIPEHLLQLAHLAKDAVVVGSLSRLEIWDQTAYHALLDNINQNATSIADRIDWGMDQVGGQAKSSCPDVSSQSNFSASLTKKKAAP